jgi:arabinogalactan endo-1,4-beta-galactosidase
LQQIPLETILEGGLTADDLALVFADQATFAAIDFTAMQNEFISGLDVDTVAQLNQAMEAFVQVNFHAIEII